MFLIPKEESVDVTWGTVSILDANLLGYRKLLEATKVFHIHLIIKIFRCNKNCFTVMQIIIYLFHIHVYFRILQTNGAMLLPSQVANFPLCHMHPLGQKFMPIWHTLTVHLKASQAAILNVYRNQ